MQYLTSVLLYGSVTEPCALPPLLSPKLRHFWKDGCRMRYLEKGWLDHARIYPSFFSRLFSVQEYFGGISKSEIKRQK